MSLPRLLLAPTHRTGLASGVAAVLAEVAGRSQTQTRLHHLGIPAPCHIWDRWEGSSFLDPGLYGMQTAVDLYSLTVAGADLSLLCTAYGLFDPGPAGVWTPEQLAIRLDAPVVLLLDCRGWGPTVGAMVEGLRNRARDINLAGLLLTGLRDGSHAEEMVRVLRRPDLPVAGCFFQGDPLTWDGTRTALSGGPPVSSLMNLVRERIDMATLENIAGQRGFLPSSLASTPPEREGPLVLVAAGRGFTPWSRDCIELLRAAGARVRRLDLMKDTGCPAETAGIIIAGYLWQETIGELAANRALMQDLRAKLEEKVPFVAMGGGLTYLLSRVRDAFGRTHELAGILPGEAEILDEVDEPVYFQVRAERDNVLLEQGEEVTGWVVQDTELLEEPVTLGYALSLSQEGWTRRLYEGAATPRLLCSRLLIHFASCRSAAARFVAACREFEAGLGDGMRYSRRP